MTYIKKINIEVADGNVVTVNFRERSPLVKWPGECTHSNVTIDEEIATIQCDDCKAQLNPVKWFTNRMDLFQYMERRFRESQLAIAAASKRTRFKCMRCGEMNALRISPADLRSVEIKD